MGPRRRLELAWGVFAAVNSVLIVVVGDYETVPFHLIWISLMLLYGYLLWRVGTALIVLAGVCVVTGATLGWVVAHGMHGPEELTEVPLMAAVFLAMVYHVERRQAALVSVERAAAREREFVRAASHHLKTPIAIARGFAALMRSESPQAMQSADLDDLIEELDRLALLTDDMLLLAAAEQHDNLLYEEIDFEDLLVTAASRRWSRMAERRWTVLPADGVLVGDRQRLDCVLDAVLDNAVRATDVGGRIAVTGRADGTDAVIEIADEGAGIALDELPHVFDRFWSRTGTGSARRGTGLGLAIARALVQAHGGAIAVDSVLGRGTTVTIRLPGLRAPTPVALVAVDAAAPAA